MSALVCNTSLRSRSSYLHVLIALHIVLKALELQVEYRRKRLEADSLFGVLQTETLRVVFVLAFKCLDLDIILERLFQIPEILDVQLDICSS